MKARLLILLVVAIMVMMPFALATAPTVTQLTNMGKKQQRVFYWNMTTNIDSNCVADTNMLRTVWEDFNHTSPPKGAINTLIYMTKTAGQNHGVKLTAANDVMSQSYRYCCAQTTYGQTNANATCGSAAFTFYYGADSIPLAIMDLGVGVPAGAVGYTTMIAIALAIVIIALTLAYVGIRIKSR